MTDKVFVPPRNAIEEMVATIWSDVLSVTSPSMNDNFFEVGGHSLLATQLSSRIKEAVQIDFPPRRLFESQTIEQISIELEGLIRRSMTDTPLQ